MGEIREKEIKCVLIADENLPPGLIANTAAVLGVTLGRLMPEECVGEDIVDGSGLPHRGIVTIPLPVLRADARKLGDIRRALAREEYSDLLVVDFTDVARSCKNYDEYKAKAAICTEQSYLGLALYGDRKKINSLTGSMPLLR